MSRGGSCAAVFIVRSGTVLSPLRIFPLDVFFPPHVPSLSNNGAPPNSLSFFSFKSRFLFCPCAHGCLRVSFVRISSLAIMTYRFFFFCSRCERAPFSFLLLSDPPLALPPIAFILEYFSFGILLVREGGGVLCMVVKPGVCPRQFGPFSAAGKSIFFFSRRQFLTPQDGLFLFLPLARVFFYFFCSVCRFPFGGVDLPI